MQERKRPLPTRDELARVWRSPEWTIRSIARRWHLGETAVKNMARRMNLGPRPELPTHHHGAKGRRCKSEPTIEDILDLRAYVLARRIVAGEPVGFGALSAGSNY